SGERRIDDESQKTRETSRTGEQLAADDAIELGSHERRAGLVAGPVQRPHCVAIQAVAHGMEPLRMCAYGTKPAFCSVLREGTLSVLQRAQGTLSSSYATRFSS